MQVPDYNEELERLIREGQKTSDMSESIGKIFQSLFDINLPPEFLKAASLIVVIVIVVFLCILVYKELDLSQFRLRRKRKTKKHQHTGFQGTAEDANIQGHQFEKELEDALQRGDYALAVNLRYLMALNRLDELQRIEWCDYKTPLMYVDEMEQGSDMLYDLTMQFLYIKYGHYPADGQSYARALRLYYTLTGEKGGGV